MDEDFYYKNVINVYENNSKKYCEHHLDGKEIIDDLKFFTNTISGNSILDIGCGPGRDLRYFRDKGFDVTGVDLCDSFLELARENIPEAVLYKQDIRDLDFQEGNFDGIWACASLLHIRKLEIEGVIKKLFFILKNNGLLYISLKKGSGESIEYNNYYEEGRFFAYYQKEEIHNILISAGFEIINSYLSDKGNTTWISIFCKKT